MAYVPPHKRLTQEGPPPTPEQLIPQFTKGVNLQSCRAKSERKAQNPFSLGKKVIYADHCISKWLAVPLTDDQQLPSSVKLVSVLLESPEWNTRDKPLTLVNDRPKEVYFLYTAGHIELKNSHQERPWASVAKKLHFDLCSSFENVRNELVDQSVVETRPHIVARFGKLLFHRSPALNLKVLEDCSVSESSARHLRKAFYTNLPQSYIEHMKNAVVPKLGLHFEEEKELYHVKVADATRPDSTISCKCRIRKDERKLELYKIEFNQVRHLIVDISCLNSNVDLRMGLWTKRILSALTDEEKRGISGLINSAILDSNVKGGLRWGLGKAKSGGRYSVVGVWHTKTETYSNSALRLSVREADRFDFITSTGEVSREAVLRLIGIKRTLLAKSDSVALLTMLEDTLKLIWDYFLAWENDVVSYCEPEP